MIAVTDEMLDAFRRNAGNYERGLVAALAVFVQQVEGTRGEGLCDCDTVPGAPISPLTGDQMDHHCDCRAVTTAAMLTGAYSETVHARQCDHGTTMDAFYQRRMPTARKPSGGDADG